jgi:alginate O-acetyltransferase complex protein AlgI
MLFNSIGFAIFLPTVFIIYWFITSKNLFTQNVFLLFAGYFFYAWWDWRFLFLLVIISIFNYLIGIKIDKTESDKNNKIWFIAAVIINIGVLGLFKYYNFFIDSFIDLASCIGYKLPGSTTRIILPVGISFYIFLSLSYIIDIYKKNLTANKNIIEVLLALSFFPIILSGPIQRPNSLLSQIVKRRDFNYAQAADGLRQILWGLFVKVVIADRLAPDVNNIFANFPVYSGSTLALGALFFSVQIYADFSGYSNMAIGISKLFGFSIIQNFAYPYFSRDITEFWKKWHISLTTWFRDYLFLPISFNISWKIKNENAFFVKKDQFIYIVSSFLTWFLIGLWHGPKYTFIIWGIIHGLFLIMYHLQKNPRKKLLRKIGINNNNFVIVMCETFITLIIIIITWVFFRADSLKEALNYVSGIFSKSLFTIPEIRPKLTILSVILFFIIEWSGRESQYAFSLMGTKWEKPFRWAFYYCIIIIIILLAGKQQEFIYFQF